MSTDDSSQLEVVPGSRPEPLSPETSLRDRLAAIHPGAWGWALSVSRSDPAEAEEILQIAYLRVLDEQARFAGRSTFKTWLFGVIATVARERRRRSATERSRRVDEPTPPVESRPGPGDHLAQTLLSSRLRRALAELSERQRQVLHLVFYQGLTIADAAQVLGISAGSARTHYERGKGNLRRILRGDGGVR